MFIVYKLTNSINGKSYIGISSRSLGARWSEHLERHRQGCRPNNRLYKALDKYGTHAFHREVMATASSEDEVRQLETFYILKFDTYRKGYNCNLGGSGFLKFPEHIRRKISEGNKGKIVSAETRANMSRAKLGDSRCAKHFGVHTNKGAGNPRARRFLFRFPDGSENIVIGLRAFCREHRLHLAHINARGRSKGYVLLKRFNDHPEREYAQAGGNGGHPTLRRDEDMVCSAG